MDAVPLVDVRKVTEVGGPGLPLLRVEEVHVAAAAVVSLGEVDVFAQAMYPFIFVVVVSRSIPPG